MSHAAIFDRIGDRAMGKTEELFNGAVSGVDTSRVEHHKILMLHKVTNFGVVRVWMTQNPLTQPRPHRPHRSPRPPRHPKTAAVPSSQCRPGLTPATHQLKVTPIAAAIPTTSSPHS